MGRILLKIKISSGAAYLTLRGPQLARGPRVADPCIKSLKNKYVFNFLQLKRASSFADTIHRYLMNREILTEDKKKEDNYYFKLMQHIFSFLVLKTPQVSIYFRF